MEATTNTKPVQRRRRRNRPLTAEQRDLAGQYFPLACRSAHRVCPGRHWSQWGAEAMSAAMLALITSAQDFHPDRGIRFATYARYRITGAVRDVYRQQCQRRGIGFRVKKIADPRNEILQVDGADAAERLLRRFPPSIATALRLVVIQDLTQTEAGQRMGVSQAQVSRLILLARKLGVT